MRALSYVFAALCVYGVIVGHFGGALLSLLVWVFVLIAQGVFATKDAAYDADPTHVKHAQASTSDALVEHDCESSRTKF